MVAFEDDAIIALGHVRRDEPFPYIGEDALRFPRHGVAIAAAARGIEPEDVAFLERVIGVAGRQALGILAVRIDPDIAGTSGIAAGAAVGRDDVLHRADRKAGVLEIEIFAADAEPSAITAGAAGILDQFETQDAGREFALDDLD